MIGELTEYKTLVTQELIERTQARVDELKRKEGKWNDTKGRLSRKD
tara:strand:- start:99 stop:236 length:138 start_codon:yes stop_codon:yes gene_type:complete